MEKAHDQTNHRDDGTTRGDQAKSKSKKSKKIKKRSGTRRFATLLEIANKFHDAECLMMYGPEYQKVLDQRDAGDENAESSGADLDRDLHTRGTEYDAVEHDRLKVVFKTKEKVLKTRRKWDRKNKGSRLESFQGDHAE